jgi:hypothetical protein
MAFEFLDELVGEARPFREDEPEVGEAPWWVEAGVESVQRVGSVGRKLEVGGLRAER